jgi:hypothetical protein
MLAYLVEASVNARNVLMGPAKKNNIGAHLKAYQLTRWKGIKFIERMNLMIYL